MTSKNEVNMGLKDQIFLNKVLAVLKGIYWTWLAWCFLAWVHLTLIWMPNDMGKLYEEHTDFLDIILDNKLGLVAFLSPLLMPIVFIIISRIRRKISMWELGIIVLTWSLGLYTFSHLRG
jgi:hypothetical protein